MFAVTKLYFDTDVAARVFPFCFSWQPVYNVADGADGAGGSSSSVAVLRIPSSKVLQ